MRRRPLLYDEGMGEPLPRKEAHRKLLAGVEAAKAWEQEDLERWRHATDTERARTVQSLLQLAALVERSRGWSSPREPLEFPGIRKHSRRSQ
jgi:hypothetical protein